MRWSREEHARQGQQQRGHTIAEDVTRALALELIFWVY